IGRLSSNWSEDFFSIAEMAQQNRSRRGVFDDEFNHIREYRTGDSQRAIHWRSSARQGELMVQEYHQNRNYDLVIGLDLWLPGNAMQTQRERVEWAVSFVGTLCREHLKSSRDTKLTLVSQAASLEVLEVGIGSQGLEYLLDFLATLDPGKQSALGEFAKIVSESASVRSRTVLVTTREEDSSTNRFSFSSLMGSRGKEIPGACKTIEADPEILGRWLVLETD
ncbi:MAG: DUF58 domain-containing protein, partial [Planctomycetaceae bacterium]|nr:DUF58 domain-containing protein [Planctomycetaceae bacterium]